MRPKLILLFGLLTCLLALVTFGVQTPKAAGQNIATPNDPGGNKNCMVQSLAMLSAELAQQNRPMEHWEGKLGLTTTNPEPTVDEGVIAWNQEFPNLRLRCIYKATDEENKSENYDTPENGIIFDRPNLWIGISQGGPHAAIVYFYPDKAVIKNGIYDPNTRTNYCETLSYAQLFERTIQIYRN